MLISLSHRFVFVANLKTASSSIEHLLRPYSEVSLIETRFGKHMSLRDIQRNFSWVMRRVPWDEMFKFAVIREPVELVLSLYNAGRKPAFSSTAQYTGNLTLEEFWASRETVQGRRWIFVPQARRLQDAAGKVGVDRVVDFVRLAEEWPTICWQCRVPFMPLEHLNASPSGLCAADVPAALAEEIRAHFADDIALLRCANGHHPARAGQAEGKR